MQQPIMSSPQDDTRPRVRLHASPKVWRGNSRIVALGHWAPERVVPIASLRSQGASEAVLRQVVSVSGVREVREVSPELSVVDLAMNAIDALFESPAVSARGIRPRDVDALIFAAVSRQYTEPATATVIHRRLGLGNAPAYDISNACLSFMDGWCSADAMLAAGQCELALVVSAESITMFRDRALAELARGESPARHFASLTLGDGAAAGLFEQKCRSRPERGVIAGARASFGEFSDLCVIPIGLGPMITDPKALFSAALEHYPIVVRPVLDASGWRPEDVDVVVTHQASKRSIVAGCREMGIDAARAVVTVPEYGNMAAVAVPFALSKAMTEGQARAGDRVLVVGLGSGIGITALSVQL